MIKNDVGKGAMYLYIQIISSLTAGYIFMILLSRITTPEIIGVFSLLVSLSEIFANIAIIGMPDGIQRFVGKNFLQQKYADAKLFVKVSLIFLSIGIAASCAVTLLLHDWLSEIFGIEFNLIVVVVLLIGSSGIYAVLYSVVIASLKTRVLPLIIITTSIARVLLSLILVLIGGGSVGLTLGYTFFGQILSAILLGIVVKNLFKKTGTLKPEVTVRNASKNLLTAGVVSWIPLLVTTLGLQMGNLILFGVHGSTQSGIYFVILAIVSAINALMYSLFTIALPALSSMRDGRKRFAWQTIRLSSIVVLPLSSSLIFYSKDIINLIGTDYIEGSLSFQILLLSMFPSVVLSGVETLVYSYGKYKNTLGINLAVNIPRTILYFIFVPLFGMTGAALSFTIGSAIGFIVSSVIAKRITMKIFWRSLFLILFIPLFIGFVFAFLNVIYIIGIILTITISYLFLMKLNILTRSDISYILGLLPYAVSKPLITVSGRIEKIMDHFRK